MFHKILVLTLAALSFTACRNAAVASVKELEGSAAAAPDASSARNELEKAIAVKKAELAALEAQLAQLAEPQGAAGDQAQSGTFSCKSVCKQETGGYLMQCGSVDRLVTQEGAVAACAPVSAKTSPYYVFTPIFAADEATARAQCSALNGRSCNGFPAHQAGGFWDETTYAETGTANTAVGLAALSMHTYQASAYRTSADGHLNFAVHFYQLNGQETLPRVDGALASSRLAK